MKRILPYRQLRYGVFFQACHVVFLQREARDSFVRRNLRTLYLTLCFLLRNQRLRFQENVKDLQRDHILGLQSYYNTWSLSQLNTDLDEGQTHIVQEKVSTLHQARSLYQFLFSEQGYLIGLFAIGLYERARYILSLLYTRYDHAV